MPRKRYLLILLTLFLVAACSSEPPWLALTVRDARTGLILEDVQITMVGQPLETQSQSEGLRVELPTAEGELVIAAPGYQTARMTLDSDTSELEQQREVELLPRRIEGIVTDAENGAPLARVVVTNGEQGAETDEQGRFALEAVALAPIRVEASTYRPAGPLGRCAARAVRRGQPTA